MYMTVDYNSILVVPVDTLHSCRALTYTSNMLRPYSMITGITTPHLELWTTAPSFAADGPHRPKEHVEQNLGYEQKTMYHFPACLLAAGLPMIADVSMYV